MREKASLDIDMCGSVNNSNKAIHNSLIHNSLAALFFFFPLRMRNMKLHTGNRLMDYFSDNGI